MARFVDDEAGRLAGFWEILRLGKEGVEETREVRGDETAVRDAVAGFASGRRLRAGAPGYGPFPEGALTWDIPEEKGVKFYAYPAYRSARRIGAMEERFEAAFPDLRKLRNAVTRSVVARCSGN